MKIITTILIAFIYINSSAQTTYPISGTLKHKETKQPIIGATVFVVAPDSTLAGGAVSDGQGKFTLNLKPGEYTIKINYLGMIPYVEPIRVWRDDYLGTLLLSENTEQLKGIEVKGQALKATVSGDTTSFNAQAYKTTQNANAGDLIEKMPGVQNTNGELKAQGEKVQQVLVDGKQFFGQDPKTALATLPAEVVDKIQIFDDQSEQSKASGVDDGTRIKTINIVTKINMRNGEFGRTYAGAGSDGRYSAGANVNMFRGDRRLSLLGQVNNINQQNFSTEDLLGVIGDNSGEGGGRGGRGPGGGGRPSSMSGFSAGGSENDFQVSASNGITKTLAGGANYQDKWGSKVDVSGSYFINRGDNNAIKNTYQLYYLNEANGQQYKEQDTTNSINVNHKLNAKIVYKVNPKMSFFYVPSISVQQNNGASLLASNTSKEAALINQLAQNFGSDLNALKMSNDLMFRFNGEKRGRSLFLQAKNDVDNTSGLNSLNSNNTITTPEINQEGDLTETTNGWTAQAMYSEPIKDKGLGAFVSYTFENSQANTHKQIMSGITPISTGFLDTSLSSRYNNDWNTHSADLGMRKFDRNGGFVVRIKFEQALLSNMQTLPMDENINKTFQNILPFAMYRRQLKNNANWNAMYRAYTTKPQASQLTNVLDNSNPLQLKTGNAQLTQQYGHWFRAKYNQTNTEKNSVFYAMISGGLSSNYITQSTLTARSDTTLNGIPLTAGTQLNMPVNADGQYNANGLVSYGFPLKRIKSNLNINVSGGVTNVPSVINYSTTQTLTQNYGFGLVLSSNISDKIDFTVSTESNYNLASNSLNQALNNQYLIQTTKVKYDWIMAKGITFRTQLQHQEYFGLSSVLNNRVLLWTAGVGKQVFKNKMGEVQLSMYDILGQNNNVAQNFYGSYYEETNSNVLTRYIMLSFSYNIRKFRESKEASEEPIRR